MSDRRTFLDAIRENPLDDTARLVYADWLDEHGSGDLDAATAEFIRVSCSRGGVVMPKAAYAWIHEHWKRLVPTAIKKHPHYRVQDKRGRVIYLNWAKGSGAKRAVRLHYCRGFVQRVDKWSWNVNAILANIKLDQPFTMLYLHEQSARIDEHQQKVRDLEAKAEVAKAEALAARKLWDDLSRNVSQS